MIRFVQSILFELIQVIKRKRNFSDIQTMMGY